MPVKLAKEAKVDYLTEKTDYEKLGLKAGLEIHQQLDTVHKSFCKCSTKMKQTKHKYVIARKLHPVASEMGEVDVAAQFEYLRNRMFRYEVFKDETCLVELDCEPPHNLDSEALEIALRIALSFNCQIPSEIQIMRKTVIDGSNPCGFQRTMIVGLNGYLKYKDKKISITQVCLEEDSASIIKEENGVVTYKNNRLGIPLVEIDTDLLIGYAPEEIQEIAYLIGLTCRLAGKTKTGIGSIRQDVNVSIENGVRVEIKGVQELSLISKVIEKEVKRQLSEKVKEETRAALPDGTTRFMRPLPGSNRMYPETDVPPIPVSEEFIRNIRKSLPEPVEKKLDMLKSKLKLSDQLTNEMIKSEYLPLFEKIVKAKNVEPSVIATAFTQTLRDLRRRGIDTSRFTETHFSEVFGALERKKIAKEAIPEILVYFSKNPEGSVGDAIRELNLGTISTEELKRVVKDIISQPEITLDRAIGLVMSKVRGKVDAQTVIKVVKELLQT